MKTNLKIKIILELHLKKTFYLKMLMCDSLYGLIKDRKKRNASLTLNFDNHTQKAHLPLFNHLKFKIQKMTKNDNLYTLEMHNHK